MSRSAALLPTGTRLNPSAPEDATYFDPDQLALVVVNDETGAFRVLTTFGESGWPIGETHEIHHDQTMRRLGRFRVVGRANFRTGEREGVVPNRKITHWVFK
jgi:hypothetical protein